MKKIVCYFLCVFVAISFCSCSSEKKPNEKWSDDAVDACLDSISIIEEVIDGTMDGEKAAQKIRMISDRLDDEDFYDGLMSTHISCAGIDVSHYGMKYSTITKRDLQKTLDDLKDTLYN